MDEGGHSEKRRRRKASSFMAWAQGGFWKEGEGALVTPYAEIGTACGLEAAGILHPPGKGTRDTPESGPHHTVRSKTGHGGPQGPAERSPRKATRPSAGFSGPESEARPRPTSLAITAMAGPSALHSRAGAKAALSDPGHGEAWATRRPLPGDGAPGWGSALMHMGRTERCPKIGRAHV